MAKKAAQSSMGEISVLCTGIGVLMRMMADVPQAVAAGVGFIVFGIGCGIVYAMKKSKFDVLFRNLGLGIRDEVYPILVSRDKKDGYELYEFTLPAGLQVQDFIDKQPEIEQHLGAGVKIDYGFKNLLIKVYEAEKTKYDYEPVATRGAMELLIGYDRSGKVVTVDLSSGEPHMYIAGETGSGKSTALREILVNLILMNDVELYLGDLKSGVEFNIFRNCKKVLVFAKSEAETVKMLREISAEVKRRYELMGAADVENIIEYNKTAQTKLKYQLLVIDEFADLMNDKESTHLLESLAAKSRACGIHLLLSTQRPDAKVLSGRIKANVSNVLGLKTLDRTNSGIIIGHNGLELLRGCGHGIFKRGSDEIYIQGPYISTERAKQIIAPFDKPKTVPKQAELKSFDFLSRL